MASVYLSCTSATSVDALDHEYPVGSGRRYAGVILDGAIITVGSTDDASIIAAAGVLIDALSKIRTAAQERLAQGWIETIQDNPPFAAISESELRALEGDR